MSRDALRRAKRVVVKIGTNALTQQTGRFNREHFEELAGALIAAATDRELIVVSSGAIALGVEALALPARPKDIAGKQACAAVGQSRLMRAYEDAFARAGRPVAQMLLTHEDVQDRRRYLNVKHALERLLEAGAVPIFNENDTVSVEEIKFGDNDTLAGLVAGLSQADALVILSDVEGLFAEDPRKNPAAERIATVNEVTPELLALCGGSVSGVGTGGMATKVRAAAKAAEVGVPSVIVSGQRAGTLARALAGEDVGTLFLARTSRRSARTAWIAHALKPKGKLTVDAGARRAVIDAKKSLLPKGILTVDGRFAQGDPVDLIGEDGTPFARGLAAYGSDELKKIAGLKTSEIEPKLGYRFLDEAVHRDDLAVLTVG